MNNRGFLLTCCVFWGVNLLINGLQTNSTPKIGLNCDVDSNCSSCFSIKCGFWFCADNSTICSNETNGGLKCNGTQIMAETECASHEYEKSPVLVTVSSVSGNSTAPGNETVTMTPVPVPSSTTGSLNSNITLALEVNVTTTPQTAETTTGSGLKHSLFHAKTDTKTDRGFHGSSFLGGMILAFGLIAIGFISFKYYKARTERLYHTL